MNKVKITCDSAADLNSLFEEKNIGVIPIIVNLGGEEYLDGTDIVPDDIYKFVAEKKVLYSNVYQYKQEIARRIVPILTSSFSSSYGITVYSLNIANIIFDEDDLERLNSKNRGSAKKALCPNCGTMLEENAKFCYNCGTKISDKKICPKCRSENSEESKFCSMCGTKF